MVNCPYLLFFKEVHIKLNNKSIDISPLLLDKLSGESQTVVMKFKADKPNSLQALFGLSNSKAGFKK